MAKLKGPYRLARTEYTYENEVLKHARIACNLAYRIGAYRLTHLFDVLSGAAKVEIILPEQRTIH